MFVARWLTLKVIQKEHPFCAWLRANMGQQLELLRLPSSRLYFLATSPRSEQLRLPVHDFIALSPADPLRKINELATV